MNTTVANLKDETGLRTIPFVGDFLSTTAVRCDELAGGKGELKEAVAGSEQWGKLGDDVVDKLRELMERFNHRLTLDNPRLIER
jgi:hypothetical protein